MALEQDLKLWSCLKKKKKKGSAGHDGGRKWMAFFYSLSFGEPDWWFLSTGGWQYDTELLN